MDAKERESAEIEQVQYGGPTRRHGLGWLAEFASVADGQLEHGPGVEERFEDGPGLLEPALIVALLEAVLAVPVRGHLFQQSGQFGQAGLDLIEQRLRCLLVGLEQLPQAFAGVGRRAGRIGGRSWSWLAHVESWVWTPVMGESLSAPRARRGRGRSGLIDVKARKPSPVKATRRLGRN